jgi:hypothetical protein
MTGRKPLGMPWDDFIDRQIREAEAQDVVDNLPGADKPIPGLEKPYDEMWWVKGFLEREGLNLLPEALELKLEVERMLEVIPRFLTEEEVRRNVAALNGRIRRLNGIATAGLGEIDMEQAMARWRRR